VGDYVLSPEICVERKSISDLKGSLASGRLYHQAEAMTKHYKTPVLLIEFEGDKAFALQASSEIGDDVQLHSLMSRIALLCLHFPRLRLIWSRSLHATADIFQQLKANQDEPDPVTAATVGVPDEAAAGGGAAPAEALVNQPAIDLLRRLPGVTEGNWRALVREAGSLADLAGLSLKRLAAIMGGQAAAKRLHEFLHQECKALFGAL
jgi:DNA excision repair protein ERCC-4